jgi:branched-chain amino acid transport system permease protein
MLIEIIDVIISGLLNGSVYALMAIGLALVYGVTKAFNFAYGSFYNMGGYFAWVLLISLGVNFFLLWGSSWKKRWCLPCENVPIGR